MEEAAAGQQRVVLKDVCPSPDCNGECEYIYQTETIPYFSDILIVSVSCPECGYRQVYTHILRETEPVRFTFRVESPDDLSVRVIRSPNGTLRIRQLGVDIEPGSACEGFVTNVEGVLDRILSVVEGVLAWAEGEERTRAECLKAEIADVRAGELPITLILEDPTGNSAIVSDRAIREPLVCDDGAAEE